jgi:hypothetical protein
MPVSHDQTNQAPGISEVALAKKISGMSGRLPLTVIDQSIFLSIHFRLVFARMRLAWLMFA